MPERSFDTGFWNDEFIEVLPPLGKLLFFYFSNNAHCNQAGLYPITLKTISNETGITRRQLPNLLEQLRPKIEWDEEQNLVWVRNFVKRQTKNPKFLIAVAKSLKDIKDKRLVRELIEYNYQRYKLSIPYKDDTDTVSIPYRDSSDTKEEEEVPEEELKDQKKNRSGKVPEKEQSHQNPVSSSAPPLSSLKITDSNEVYLHVLECYKANWAWAQGDPDKHAMEQMKEASFQISELGGCPREWITLAFDVAGKQTPNPNIPYVAAIVTNWMKEAEQK